MDLCCSEPRSDWTISCISDAFRVDDIASYELEFCRKEDNPEKVLQEFIEYDQIPIKEENQIVGVLERFPQQGNNSFHIHPLDDGILVSADESLANILSLLAKPPYYRLVIKGSNIKGIVTKSDTLKLPVRVYSFGLITHLESIMIDKINKFYGSNTEWVNFLSSKRIGNLNKKLEEFKKDRLDPSLIELTDFCDKRTIMKKTFQLENAFEKDLHKIEKLRNNIAHATKYVGNNKDLEELIYTLEKCMYWITRFQNSMTNN